ncbi:hypothetical protein [Polyangium fumosum]|uniref:Uncharacterized protein n=1 Tax=Polyangium fumosum TaxID=889272 RepID=A0A4U1IPP5_9BACT|nr:hypothetical protein [Polyangium fumosum]TKC95866.1 hypothetical protein E8A74_46050 [Polyangium fumosum]
MKDKGKRLRITLRVLTASMLVALFVFEGRALLGPLTRVFPRACAAVTPSPPAVETTLVPAHVLAQENLCQNVSDGHCERLAEGAHVSGACTDGAMVGDWTVKDAATGALRWSGHYEGGWASGVFQVCADATHCDSFRIDHLHLDGPAVTWERDGDRWIELSGRYERGRRVGRWVRRIDGKGAARSALVHDEQGLGAKEFFYCTNGNLKEIRGRHTLVYDAQNHLLAERGPEGPLRILDGAGSVVRDARPDEETTLCPLP